MNDLDKLQRVIALCKHGVYLEVNEHRDVYQSAAERLAEYDSDPSYAPDILDDGARAKMVETNTIIGLQFYPESAGSFHHAIHHDLGELLDWAYGMLVDTGVKRRHDAELAKTPKVEPENLAGLSEEEIIYLYGKHSWAASCILEVKRSGGQCLFPPGTGARTIHVVGVDPGNARGDSTAEVVLERRADGVVEVVSCDHGERRQP